MALLRQRGGSIVVEEAVEAVTATTATGAPRLSRFKHWRSSSTRVILASAERVDGENAAKFRRITMPWQYAALNYYDSIGEIHYASGFYARAFQKVRLYVGERDGEGNIVPSENEEAMAILDRIQDPAGGRETICDRYGRLTFICGECYLLWTKTGPGDDEESWEIVSIDELKPTEDGKALLRQRAPGLEIETVRAPDALDPTPAVGEGIAYRLWNPHPRWSFLADSPMRAVVDICDELYLLTLAVSAQAKSQAARAGLLLLPDEISNPEPASDVIGDEDPQEDPFFADLTEQITLPITDPASAAALVPMIVRGPAEFLKELRRVGLFDEAVHYQEIELRKEAIRRIGLSLDMPPEVLLGLSESNHWCQDESTEILVRGRGWVTHDQLAVGDVVYTLNHDTGMGEWLPVLDMYRADVQEEQMFRMRSRSHSSVSTPQHRWPIVKTGPRVAGSRRRWTTSADGFASTDRVPVAAPLTQDEIEATYPDDLVRLLVAFTADGTVLEHGNVRVAKFANGEIVEMRRILTSLFGANGFREHDHPTASGTGTSFVLRQAEASLLLQHCGPEKAIGLRFVDDLTAAQKQLFLDSCVEIGDGVADDAATTLYQVRPERLEAFAYAAHLTGHKVTRGRRNQQTGYGTEPLSWVTWSRERTTFSPAACDHDLVAYSGVVWCPVTANQTWFARRDGRAYFTGNTAWQIEQQAWAHLAPAATQMCMNLTSAYLRPAARAAGIDGWEKLVVWYDAQELLANPDRGKDADSLYDRRAIGKEALREAHGFTDEDAPTDEELEEMLLVELGKPVQVGNGAIVVEETSVEEPPTGVDTEEKPPQAPDGISAGTEADADGGDLNEMRVRLMTGAEMAVWRIREIACTRAKAAAQGCPDCAASIRDLDRDLVPYTLGRQTLKDLGMTATKLVAGAGEFYVQQLVSWGVPERSARSVSAQLEALVASSLFVAPTEAPPKIEIPERAVDLALS